MTYSVKGSEYWFYPNGQNNIWLEVNFLFENMQVNPGYKINFRRLTQPKINKQ